MKLLFKVERFWPIVEGTKPKPVASTVKGVQALPSTGKDSIVKWEDKDTLALSIITIVLKIPSFLIFNSVNHPLMHDSNFVTCMRQKMSFFRMYLQDKLQSLKMRDTDNVTKHVHTFCSILEPASIESLVDEEDAILSLMKSMPSVYKPYLTTLKRQQGLTLQGLIVDLLQEEVLLKDLEFGNGNTKALFVRKTPHPSYQKKNGSCKSFFQDTKEHFFKL